MTKVQKEVLEKLSKAGGASALGNRFRPAAFALAKMGYVTTDHTVVGLVHIFTLTEAGRAALELARSSQ